MTTQLEPLARLSRDVRKASTTMGSGEARTLVDLYYQLQDFRIQAGNQNRQLTKVEEPHETVGFFHEQFVHLEDDIRKALDTYSKAQPLGEWARENVGIGPVIAAGLLAHIDITQSPTPSALWKFAGQAPDQKYVKGEKRSWNARLKVLCWRMGDSFVKQSGRENCYYGHLYRQRKEREVARNEAVLPWDGGERPNVDVVEIDGKFFMGGNAAAAAKSLREKTIKDPELKAVLRSGKLPDGQLDLRARRVAQKRFLLHYWQCAWILEYHEQPPRAYVFEQLGHVHEDPPPVALPKP